jgi:predicted Na+-dependent transporter
MRFQNSAMDILLVRKKNSRAGVRLIKTKYMYNVPSASIPLVTIHSLLAFGQSQFGNIFARKNYTNQNSIKN